MNTVQYIPHRQSHQLVPTSGSGQLEEPGGEVTTTCCQLRGKAAPSEGKVREIEGRPGSIQTGERATTEEKGGAAGHRHLYAATDRRDVPWGPIRGSQQLQLLAARARNSKQPAVDQFWPRINSIFKT
jgi:hypothetical protein